MLPSQGVHNNQTFVVDGYVPPPGANMNLATVTQVIGNFFPAMGIRLLHGRFFTEADHAGTQLVRDRQPQICAALLAQPGPHRQTHPHRHRADADAVAHRGGRGL